MAEAWRSTIKSYGKFPPAKDLCLINSQFLLQSRYQVDVSADVSLRIPSRVVMVIIMVIDAIFCAAAADKDVCCRVLLRLAVNFSTVSG